MTIVYVGWNMKDTAIYCWCEFMCLKLYKHSKNNLSNS